MACSNNLLFCNMIKVIMRFGLLAVAFLLLLQLTNYNIVSRAWGSELVIGVAAVLLIGMGIYLSRYIFQPRTMDKAQLDTQQISQLGISKREYQVLQEMAQGKSNLQIAETLFISESTVKTHVSNLLLKLDAQRRTEAITKAQKLHIL